MSGGPDSISVNKPQIPGQLPDSAGKKPAVHSAEKQKTEAVREQVMGTLSP